MKNSYGNKHRTFDWNIELLDNSVGMIHSPTDLKACLNSHGLYDTFQFVLRLSPVIHRKIAAMPGGIVKGGIDFDSLQAYSTYVHETIHWWQHIGSTAGLMLSLSYPAQAHVNYTHLKNLTEHVGPQKSVLRFVEKWGIPGGKPETPSGLANTIVNNHFDIEFYRLAVKNPALIKEIIKHPLFECIGHSYEIAYGNIILLLATTLDPSFCLLPDPRDWENKFDLLRAKEEEGFYRGSNVTIPPVGADMIFEGQARFSQLQYLYFASDGQLTWDIAHLKGMIEGTYKEAFEVFLRLTELDWPPLIDHPVIALFLLVCDIALNPGTGFPMPLQDFPTFITDVDPGFRFVFLCRTIARQPDLAQAIQQYSKDEYANVSEALTRPLNFDSPLSIASTVGHWENANKTIMSLSERHENFDYSVGNLTMHLLFSHFLAFNKDKLLRPEFFCWPGAWTAGDRVSDEIARMFEYHSAPFLDKADDGGIYPRLMKGKSEAAVQSTFNNFYAENVSYDMTRQWVAMQGPFEYDYRWLSSTATQAEMIDFVDRHFEHLYGVHPNVFEIL